MLKRIFGAAVLVLCAVVGGRLALRPARASSDLPVRAFAASIAADGQPPAAPTPTRPAPPPPGPGYCAGNSDFGAPTPPNAVIGTLTIGGQPAPANTLVTLTFDGKPGPSAYTDAPGGYRIFYAAGGQGFTPPCINEVGSEIGLLVNGQVVESGGYVGDDQTRLVFRFDVAVP